MSKILIISDIHINDWDTRDPEFRFRLYQNRKVAQNIIEVAKQNEIEYIAIAGDLFHKPVNKPYILGEVDLFLKTIMSYFKVGFIIWGNHDMDSKDDNQEFTDSPGAVMLPNNLYYSDKKFCQLEGTTIAFSNWKANFDLSWLQVHANLLITHATIQYTGGPKVNSQILDETKFDLAICGDIHFPAQNGKFVSIGVPQQNKVDDSPKSTGVVFDLQTKQWDWINLNPNNNLLKFEKTTDSLLDGYDKSTNTWRVYSPQNITSAGSIDTTKLTAISDIDNLINSSIVEEDLVKVHKTILSNCKSLDAGEVDFNFTLTRLVCKNWRSIKDLDICFAEGDRILIQGPNGAGKSSILSALKYALIDAKSVGTLNPFIKNGEKSCWTEIHFTYQGKYCTIRRGSETKNCYCTIDGNKLNFKDKSSFEKEMKEKFPFINYIDAFFFDEGHQKFIGDCGESVSTIISKYLRLDKIDLLCSSAVQLYGDLKNKTDEVEKEIRSYTKNLEYIEQKINETAVPSRGLSELEREHQEGLVLQESYTKYVAYQERIHSLKAEINSMKTTMSDNSQKLKNTNWPSDQDISSCQEQITTIELALKDRVARINRKTSLESDLQAITQKGQTLNQTINELKPNTCPKCGQSIGLDMFNKYKEDLISQLNQLRDDYVNKKSELDQIVIESGDDLRANLNTLKANLSNYLSAQSEYKYLINTCSDYNDKINSKELELAKLISESGPEIVLPDRFFEKMSSIATDIQIWSNYNKLVNDRQVSINLINSLKSDIQVIEGDLELLLKYIKLTSSTGKIYETIMRKLAQEFSDNLIEYDVDVKEAKGNRKDHLTIVPKFRKNGYKVQYQVCSQGQKTIMDIHLLLKITTRNGLLVLDEFLSHLNQANHEICLDMISKMNVGCIMLSSHMESLPGFFNKRMNLSLVNDETNVLIV